MESNNRGAKSTCSSKNMRRNTFHFGSPTSSVRVNRFHNIADGTWLNPLIRYSPDPTIMSASSESDRTSWLSRKGLLKIKVDKSTVYRFNGPPETFSPISIDGIEDQPFDADIHNIETFHDMLDDLPISPKIVTSVSTYPLIYNNTSRIGINTRHLSIQATPAILPKIQDPMPSSSGDPIQSTDAQSFIPFWFVPKHKQL